MKAIPILLSGLLLASQAHATAVFHINSKDQTKGDAKKCTLVAAFQNINYKDTSGIVLQPKEDPNPDCPAGQADNLVYFDKLPPGPSGRPEIMVTTPISHLANEVTVVGGLLDGGGKSAIFRVAGKATLVLEAVWLQNGSGGSGGAILVENDASLLTANRTRFVRNKAIGNGGAVAFLSTGSLTMLQTYFGKNETPSGLGGALWVGTTTQQALVADSVFEGNAASGGGGAIYCSSGATPLGVETSDFRGNTVTSPDSGLGGAVLSACKLELRIDGIYNNTVRTGDGGAVYDLGTGSLAILDSSFRSNAAGSEGGGNGGAIHANGPMSVVRSGFHENAAAGRGGAIYVDDSATENDITIANSTFAENQAYEEELHVPLAGGAVWIADVAFTPNPEPRFRVLNNTFFDNLSSAQFFVEDNGNSDTGSILFVNNILQNTFSKTFPNCDGRIERLRLKTGGIDIRNTQFPGTSCDQAVDKVPIEDLKFTATKLGGYFNQPYHTPGKALPVGDYGVCNSAPIDKRDQLKNVRECRQGAVEGPPKFVWSTAYLPY